VALEVADLTEVPDGLRLLIRKSKTDQEGHGQEVAILRGVKICPVEAVQTWLARAQIRTGFLFRSVLHGRTLGDSGGRPSKARAKALQAADDLASRFVKGLGVFPIRSEPAHGLGQVHKLPRGRHRWHSFGVTRQRLIGRPSRATRGRYGGRHRGPHRERHRWRAMDDLRRACRGTSN
jgi:hypothetical protein